MTNNIKCGKTGEQLESSKRRFGLFYYHHKFVKLIINLIARRNAKPAGILTEKNCRTNIDFLASCILCECVLLTGRFTYCSIFLYSCGAAVSLQDSATSE